MISQSQFAKAIGYGKSSLSIISSAVLASTLFFYIFSLGSIFKIPIFIIEDRLTNNTYFTDTYVISRNVDHVIIAAGTLLWLVLSLRGKIRSSICTIYVGLLIFAFLTGLDSFTDIIISISIPVIASLIIYNKLSREKILNIYNGLSINYLSIMGIVISFIAVIISSASIFSIPITPLRNYAYDIFVLMSSSSPILMFLLINSFPLKMLLNEFVSEKIIPLWDVRIRRTSKIIYISCIMMLSVSFVLIPHQTTVNRYNKQIGADTHDYVISENKLLNSKDAEEFFRNAFIIANGGDRPIALVFLFAIITAVPDVEPSYVLDYVPVILSPALILAAYFLTRELTSNDIAAILTSFLTVVSFQSLVGIYAGFYANWLALIIGYLSFLFLIRFLKTPARMNIFGYSVLMILLLFTHTYTWTILTMVMGIFLAVLLKFKHYCRKNILLLFLVIASCVSIDLLRNTIAASSSGIERDLQIMSHGVVGLTSQGIGIEQFGTRWNNLTDSMQSYFGALFSNFIILILGLYWLVRCRVHELSSIFVMSFLSIGIVPIFFGDGVVQSRVFYEIPFQIPSAIALTYLKTRHDGNIIVLSICVWLVSVSIIMVSNFSLGSS